MAGFGVVKLDEMKLHVLPRGDVTETARVSLADVGQRLELLARQNALRNLHAQHLRVLGLPLTVGAAHEPERAPLIGRHLTPFVALERRHELVDVGLAGKGQPRSTVGFCIVSCRHASSLCVAVTYLDLAGRL